MVLFVFSGLSFKESLTKKQGDLSETSTILFISLYYSSKWVVRFVSVLGYCEPQIDLFVHSSAS